MSQRNVPVVRSEVKSTDWKQKWNDLGEFWYLVLAALSRLAAAYIFAKIGPFVDQAITSRFPSGDGWPEAKELVDGITVVALIVLHLYLSWDMLAVFITWLRGRRK